MLAEAFPLGHWKNFREMEVSLTLEELYLLLEVNNEGEYNRRKFAAALKGIDLEDEDDDNGDESDFDRIRREADEELTRQGQDTRSFDQRDIDDLFGFNSGDDD